jgi:hypothetical protein
MTPNDPSQQSDEWIDKFIETYWDDIEEYKEATQDDQDDPSVWEQK